jgi:hypothetical protein
MPITGSQKAQLYAMSGVERSGTTRSNVHSKQIFVQIAGVHYATGRAGTAQVDEGTLTIQETDGETPNTCSFQVRGVTPSNGQEVIITQGSKNNLDREFAGRIINDTSGYVGIPTNSRDQVNVIDYTWDLTRETITRRWTSESATAIAEAIIADAGRGLVARVEQGLETIDEFTVTNEPHITALRRLAERGGWKVHVSYLRTVFFGSTVGTETDPTTLTAASMLLTEAADLKVRRDLAPVITKQPGEGGGSSAPTEVAPGETILPVEDPAWYATSGLVAVGPQVVAYAGLATGGGGSLVGPGASASTAPSGALVQGGTLTIGTYQYAYTFVTAAGQSLPGPVVAISTHGALTPPDAVNPDYLNTSAVGAFAVGAVYRYKTTFVLAGGGESLASAASYPITTIVNPLASPQPKQLTFPIQTFFTDRPEIVACNVYRTLDGGSIYHYVTQVARGGILYDGLADSSISGNANPPTSDSSNTQQVAVTGVAVGPSGTTSRNVYRTSVNGAQLKLLGSIANNTATSFGTDTLADASLGANAPTSDTSGLTQPSGQVLAGSPTLPVASAAPFATSGGWAVIGNGQQMIRYTGISGSSLTGIPTSGAGAIVATVSYNSTVTSAAALTGIPASGPASILYTIKKGDPVNIRVIETDGAAQTTIAALIGGGDDGVIEGRVIQDGRLSETEIRARCQAQLALRSTLDVGITYTTHDINSHGSRTIAASLAAPSIASSFRIRQVTISHFTPQRWQIHQVTASSRLFTLEDLLRITRVLAAEQS